MRLVDPSAEVRLPSGLGPVTPPGRCTTPTGRAPPRPVPAPNARSSVAQRQSIRLLTGGLLVRIQPEEPPPNTCRINHLRIQPFGHLELPQAKSLILCNLMHGTWPNNTRPRLAPASSYMDERAMNVPSICRPQLHPVPNVGGYDLGSHNDVGNVQSPTRLQHAEGFGNDPVIVARQFDLAYEELNDRQAGLLLILADSDSMSPHVEPIWRAGRTDALSGQQHVDLARSEIQHCLARPQLRE